MTLLNDRLHEAELLDGAHHEPRELAHSLEHVRKVSRWLGGLRSLRHHLEPLLTLPQVRLLDVGTGNGGVLEDLLGWGRSRGSGPWTGTGLDNHAEILDAARLGRGLRPAPSLVLGDALSLPFADRSFDAVLSNLTLHHLCEPDAVLAVEEMIRVSRFLVLVSDLERSLLNYLGARFLSATWWRSNRITRHDGPLSVLRSFTPAELLEIGRRARLPAVRIRRHVPFLLVLEGRVS